MCSTPAPPSTVVVAAIWRAWFHYDLGFRERAALALFHDRAAALSLAPKGIDLDRALARPGAPMSQ